MKFKIKNVNVSYEMWWSKEWFTHHNIEKGDSIDISIKELKKLAPNEKEYEAMKRDFDNLDKEKQNEVTEYLTQVKNGLKTLGYEVLEAPVIKEIIAKLENKIQNLQESWKDNYKSREWVVTHTQLALLNIMGQSKIDKNDWAI